MAETRSDRLEDEVVRLKAILRRWLIIAENEDYGALLTATRAAVRGERRKAQRRKNPPGMALILTNRVAMTDRRKGV